MTSPVRKYGFINAKLRTRISKILPDDFMMRLSRAHSITEAVQLFKNTQFSGIVAVYTKTGDLKMVELELLKHEINMYVELEKFMEPDILSFVRVLAARFEVDNLKNILRLWFDKTIRKRDIQEALLYIYKARIHFDLHWDQVLAAEDLTQVSHILGSTPYSEIIYNAREEVNEKQSLFVIEAMLDKYYYTELIKEVEKLKKQDHTIARRLIGVEIDLQNINLIVRFKKMYHFSFEEAMGYLLPYGYSVNKQTLSDVFETQDVTKTLKGFMEKRYSGLKALLSTQTSEGYSRLVLIERVLDQIMMYEVQKVLLSNPFTIGIILVYFILKRNEIRKIITILNAKYYNIAEDRIKSRM